MKKIIIPLFFILFTQLVSAQPKPIPDETYGEGGYRIESETVNVNGERETHVEYFDKGRNKKKRETITFKKDDVTVKTTILFDCQGGQIYKREQKRDKLGNEVEDISEAYDEKTREIKSGYKYVLENGKMKLYIYDDESGTYEPAKFNERILISAADFEKEQYCCMPRQDIFLGYSFLSLTGENGESFPLGAHLVYTYLLTRSVGLVADMSIHGKKDNDLRITRAFLMAGLQYHLVKQRQKALLVYLRLLVGLATDRQKYGLGESNTSKANALAIATGFGLSYPVNKMISISLVPDYIFTRFNEESQGHIRASAGIRINLGCK